MRVLASSPTLRRFYSSNILVAFVLLCKYELLCLVRVTQLVTTRRGGVKLYISTFS